MSCQYYVATIALTTALPSGWKVEHNTTNLIILPMGAFWCQSLKLRKQKIKLKKLKYNHYKIT